MLPHGRVRSTPERIRLLGLYIVCYVAIVLLIGSSSRAAVAPPSPAVAPVIGACTYIPNPRANLSLSCGDTSLHAVANLSVHFQVRVSDASNNSMNVTFFFDYWSAIAQVNPASPSRTVEIPAPGAGVTVNATTSWTYASPNANLSGGQYFVFINVTNGAGESDPNAGTFLFPVYVAYDQPPFMDGLQSLNSVSPPIPAANPVVPLVYENVTVGDPDADPVTLTWNWGDGTRTVNKTGPLTSPLPLSVSHQYSASFLPLNQTPRSFDVPVVVWIDDGAGHNLSLNSTTEFYLEFDSPPTVRIDRPTVGSIWKVNETVTMEGNVTDPEGSPITVYWDFDNRTDSTHIGDPTRNQDALGTSATHAYTKPGVYNITLWATDGNKETCVNANCSIFTTHWVSAVQPITVRFNLPPVLAIVNVTTVIDHSTALRASVYDPDGDSMNLTWKFDDGTPNVFNVTGSSPRNAPTVFTVIQDHNYTTAGFHNYTVTVSDGNATVSETKRVFVQSFNLPPVLLNALVYRANGTLAGNNTFAINETVIVKVSLYDPENDTLDISVNWSDGSPDNRTSVDPRTSAGCSLDNRSRNVCTIMFRHVYVDVGCVDCEVNLTAQVTVTDHRVYLTSNGTNIIEIPHEVDFGFPLTIDDFVYEGLGPWDWWDYSTLAVALGIPSLLIARFAWKVHLERQEA